MGTRLMNKRIIMTGAVNNIGHAAATGFIAEGARVVIADIDETGGSRTAASLGPNAHFIKTDVSQEPSIRELFESGARWLGGLDVLVQNAAIQHSGAISEFHVAKWDALFSVNARGVFLGAKHAIPYLRQSGRGSIINTSSLAGKRGPPGVVAYSASKGAVIAFSTALALELANNNIRVNAICPGWVDTPFNQPAIDYMGGRAAQDAAVKAMVPLGRQAMPSEIAPLFVYLASDESSYVTAQSFNVDGGVYN
jgi:NAD(P)-dependent dehydrogenase (short-subunit alcohol dehydrogenase family)